MHVHVLDRRCRHHPVPFEVFVKMPPALGTILANGSASQQAASTWLGGLTEPDEISVRVLSLGKVAGNMAYWCCPMALLPVGYHVVVTLRTSTLEVKLDCEVVSNAGVFESNCSELLNCC